MNDGGPAFPVEYRHWEHLDAPASFKGMTLRDYFAAQIICGIYANSSGTTMSGAQKAKWAYEIADAMIAARSL